MNDAEFQQVLIDHLERVLTRYGRWLPSDDAKLINAMIAQYQQDIGVVRELKKIYEAM